MNAFALEPIEKAPLADLKKLQLQRLRWTLQHAYDHVPHYRRKFDAAGVKPEALVGLLAWSCGWLPRIEPVTPRDLLPHFRLAAIPRTPFVLTADLLAAINYRAG